MQRKIDIPFYIAIALSALLLVSCEKSIFNKYSEDLSARFAIERKTELGDKQVETVIASSSGEDKEVSDLVSLNRQSNDIILKLSGVANAPFTSTNLQLAVQFLGITDPYDMSGPYQFPADNKQVAVSMSWNDGHGWQTFTAPISGNFTMTYDLLTLTWQGSITNLHFERPANSNYLQQNWQANFQFVKFGEK